ncbi:MAG TPA: D-glycero-beta-D-manno-heptose 1-phosphate adenylyltransferase [Gammaproteobacteria bacterium]
MTNPAGFIPAFRDRKVLVIGDAILDVYEKGRTEKLCREAPVPVVRLQERAFSCGGAANTAVNTAALGGEVSFLGVLGADREGDKLLDALAAQGVDTRSVIRTKHRRTITKTRVCASSSILVRVDEGDTAPIDRECAAELVDSIRRRIDKYDVVILSDYNYGLFSEEVLNDLKVLFASGAPPLVVDAKHPDRFRGLKPAAVKPNYEEAVNLLQVPALVREPRVEQIMKLGDDLLEKTGSALVAATLDVDGAILFERGAPPYLVSCLPQPDRHTIGAGDSFVGALALAIATGAPPRAAARLAAAAAAVVIRKDGTGICTAEELSAYFRGHTKRVTTIDALMNIVCELRQENRRIVFTNGCFDILHRGHVEFLRQARSLGDTLIVALNSDESIRAIKGKGRPVNALEDRIEVLAGLQAVDLLIRFDGESPSELLRAVRPDVFAKGGTYSVDSLPEAELVRSLGGDVEIVPFRSTLTTSRLIERIQHPAGIPAVARNDRQAL